MQERRNLIPKAGLAATLLFFAACWAVVGTSGTAEGDPIEVLGLGGTAVLYGAILLTFATMFIAARRAYASGSWPWLLAVIFVWPLSYLYALAVNRGD